MLDRFNPVADAQDAGDTPEYTDIHCDVLVVGAGAAGLRTAIELREHDITDVLVVGTEAPGEAHILEAGGINAALGNRDPEDSWAVHAAETLRAGHGISDPEGVELVCNNVAECVKELKVWGCDFARTDDGQIDQRYSGGQAYRRTCFVGDRTGDAVATTLAGRADELDIPHRENVYITKLLAAQGKIAGAAGFDTETGELLVFHCRAVVLAAGGYANVYDRSSSYGHGNVGRGPGLAYDAGARLQDMEMVQFHPTGTVGDYPGLLVTEAVRGDGGKLFNADGDRFMEDYDADRMELAPRDVMARAIHTEIQEGRGTDDGGVLLDISHKDESFITERLPHTYETFQELGVDITEERMPVAPTAHYTMGGVQVDFETGETAVEGLFAVGQTAGGLHGATLLGGNALAAAVTCGEIFGGHIAEYVEDSVPEPVAVAELDRHLHWLDTVNGTGGDHDPRDVIADLRQLMWVHAGIVREEGLLKDGLSALEDIEDKAANLDIDGDRSSERFVDAMDLQFMLPVAEAILHGALIRDESRGAHYREDAPETDETWRKHIVYWKGPNGHLLTHSENVDPVPRAVQDALDEEHELEYPYTE